MIIPFPYPINIVIIVLIDLIGIYLSFWVYWSDKGNKANRGFSLMVATVLAWVNFYYLNQGNDFVIWGRLAAASVFSMFVAYYFFVVRWFLQKAGWYKSFGIFVFIYGAIFGILSVTTGIIISRSDIISSVLTKPVLSPIGWWILYMFAIVVTGIINWALIKEYLVYPKENKVKIRYFLIGLLIFAGLNIIFNVLIPALLNDYRFYELGNYSILFFLVFTAYAIVKHRLFNIKILASQLLVFAIWTFVAMRMVLSNSKEELFINAFLMFLVFIAGILLLRTVTKEAELTKKLLEEAEKNLDLEQQLHKAFTEKTGEIIKKMEDIVKN